MTSVKYELCDRNLELYRVREDNSQLKDAKFGFRLVKKSGNWLHFFTGFLSVSVFMRVVNCVRGKAAICHSHLSTEDHVLVVLMKLRLGLLNKDIAHIFGIQTSTISNIYRSWLPIISSSLQNLIVWPDRANIESDNSTYDSLSLINHDVEQNSRHSPIRSVPSDMCMGI